MSGRAYRREVRHLVVIVPGFLGSVLRRGDRDLWNLSPSVLACSLASRGQSLEELVSPTSQLSLPDFRDGVEPTGLIKQPVSVPGLARLPGYAHLVRALKDAFFLNEANFCEFAYDWRRSIEFTSARLDGEIRSRLEILDRDSYVRSEVIIIAHSMGGLVARHWLNNYTSSDRCRAIITLGTPFRGSPKTIRFLADGYVWKSLRSRRVADVFRSFPAMHELLPVYPCVRDRRTPTSVAAGPIRVTEVDGDLPGIDGRSARNARDLLHALNTTDRPTLTTAIAGVGQRTLQGITILPGNVLDFQYTTCARDGRFGSQVSSDESEYDGWLAEDYGLSNDTDGDGSVPWISGRPLDRPGAVTSTHFVNEGHGGLSSSDDMMSTLKSRLAQVVMDNDPARGPFDGRSTPESSRRRALRLGLDLDEEYSDQEPAGIRITADGFAPGTLVEVCVAGNIVDTCIVGDRMSVTVGPLQAGLHSVTATATDQVSLQTRRVTDLLDVWPGSF